MRRIIKKIVHIYQSFLLDGKILEQMRKTKEACEKKLNENNQIELFLD